MRACHTLCATLGLSPPASDSLQQQGKIVQPAKKQKPDFV
jgi:hypothetical protein